MIFIGKYLPVDWSFIGRKEGFRQDLVKTWLQPRAVTLSYSLGLKLYPMGPNSWSQEAVVEVQEVVY